MKTLAFAVTGLLASSASTALAQSTVRVSVSSSGLQGNNHSGNASLSSDGRLVAYASWASNLTPGDFGGYKDVFVTDMRTGLTRCASLGLAGAAANETSDSPRISADGRYVAFESTASNLTPGDTPGTPDIFRRDLLTGTTERATLEVNGQPAPGICGNPAISGDGNWVSFWSWNSALVVGDLNGVGDAFVRNMSTGTTELVSIATNGAQGNNYSTLSAISADGRFVAFTSAATNFAPVAPQSNNVFLRDRIAGTTILISESSGGAPGDLDSGLTSLSSDGRFVVFTSIATNLAPGDTNDRSDVFLRDVLLGTTECISVTPAGVPGNFASVYGDASDDGRFVAFQSDATDLVVQPPFEYMADVFLRDRTAGTTVLLTSHSNSAGGADGIIQPSISHDGHIVAFTVGGGVTSFVPGDVNGVSDVLWMSDLPAPPAPTLFGVGKVNSWQMVPKIAPNGRPSLSSLFQIQCVGARENLPGLLLYGANGPANVPFSGGTLYVHAPVRRSIGSMSANAGFAINMNQFARGALGGNPAAALTVVGTVIDCQWWGRDVSGGTQLSNAMEYVVAP